MQACCELAVRTGIDWLSGMNMRASWCAVPGAKPSSEPAKRQQATADRRPRPSSRPIHPPAVFCARKDIPSEPNCSMPGTQSAVRHAAFMSGCRNLRRQGDLVIAARRRELSSLHRRRNPSCPLRCCSAQPPRSCWASRSGCGSRSHTNPLVSSFGQSVGISDSSCALVSDGRHRQPPRHSQGPDHDSPHHRPPTTQPQP